VPAATWSDGRVFHEKRTIENTYIESVTKTDKNQRWNKEDEPQMPYRNIHWLHNVAETSIYYIYLALFLFRRNETVGVYHGNEQHTYVIIIIFFLLLTRQTLDNAETKTE
jgi:hypothetical protein